MAPSQKDTVRVLVTGYGPFMQYKENPSWLAVKPLHDTTLKVVTQPPTGEDASSLPEASRKVHITALGIPTSYDFVLQNIPGLHEKPPVAPVSDDPAYFPADLPPKGFHFILHVGVAGPGSVTLETVGHKTGYGLPDANGKLAPVVGTDKQGREVRGFAEGYEELPEELRTSIDAPSLKKHLQETSVKNVGVSTDAGHCLCDFGFYCSLAETKKRESERVPVLFFHCPPIGQPYSTEEVTDAITKVVEWVGGRVPL